MKHTERTSLMTNLSRRNILSGGAAIAVTASSIVAMPVLAQAIENSVEPMTGTHVLNMENDINFPHFTKGDNLLINYSIDKYIKSGWYLWKGGIYRVELHPDNHKRDEAILVAYQVSGAISIVSFEDFEPDGRVISSHRDI